MTASTFTYKEETPTRDTVIGLTGHTALKVLASLPDQHPHDHGWTLLALITYLVPLFEHSYSAWLGGFLNLPT